MKRKRFSEGKIIEILKLHGAGAKPADLCRQHGISETTLYNWRTRYDGIEVSDAKAREADCASSTNVELRRPGK